jgi:hypothetical protein
MGRRLSVGVKTSQCGCGGLTGVHGCKSVATGCVTIPSSPIRQQRKQKPLAKSAVNMFGVKKKLKAGINKKKTGEINL